MFALESSTSAGNPKGSNPTKIQKWESEWIPCVANTDGSVSIPSSVFDGQKPDKAWFELRIDTADAGYSAGDIIMNQVLIWDRSGSPVDTQTFGVAISINSANTEFYYSFGVTGVPSINKTNGAANSIEGNSSMKIYAERTILGDVPDITRVGLVPLEREVVTSGDADVTFNLQQYFNEYESFAIEAKNLKNVTDNVQPYFRCSDDGGVTYRAGATDYNTNYHGAINGVSAISQIVTTAGYVSVATTGTGANEEANAIMSLTGFDDPDVLNIVYVHSGGINATPEAYSFIHTTYSCGKDVLTHIQFSALTGNLDRGTYILYGYRKVP